MTESTFNVRFCPSTFHPMSVIVYRQVSQEQLRLKTEVSCRSECFIWSLNIINQRYPIRKETKLLLVDWVVAYIQAFLMMMESLTTYCSCTISYYPRLLDCCLLLAYCVATGTLWSLYFIGLPGEDQKRFLMSLPCLKNFIFWISSSWVIPCVNHKLWSTIQRRSCPSMSSKSRS